MKLQNRYLADVYQQVETRNQGEKEFLQAVYEVMQTLELVVEKNPSIIKTAVIDRLVEPERMIEFRVPWVDDEGNIHVQRGFRVQFNSAIGPYKGGLRFHPSVNASIIKFLGFEQVFKNALTTLPIGGGKGGSDFNPKGKSEQEIMRFCQSFMTELYKYIGADVDVPAGDMGVGAREIGFLFGQYKRISGEYTGTITGKGLTYGGSLVRKEATGYGLCYITEKMLKELKNTTFEGKKVIVSGSGNVAIYAAQKAQQLGGKVIAMSDSKGCIIDPNGIDLALVKKIKEQDRESLILYKERRSEVTYKDNPAQIWQTACDIALPCATQNELDAASAQALIQNGVTAVCEGANMPCTPEAIALLQEHHICYLPGKASNAGGVACSALEMSQNAMRYSWGAEEVDQRLKGIMENIFANIYTISKQYGVKGNFVAGSNIAAFQKVADAMMAQGVV